MKTTYGLKTFDFPTEIGLSSLSFNTSDWDVKFVNERTHARIYQLIDIIQCSMELTATPLLDMKWCAVEEYQCHGSCDCMHASIYTHILKIWVSFISCDCLFIHVSFTISTWHEHQESHHLKVAISKWHDSDLKTR